MSEHIQLIMFILIVGGICVIFLQEVVHGRTLEKMRLEAIEAFRHVHIRSNDPKFSFAGSDAIIIKIEEPANPQREPASWFILTIFARNEFGEYFMFKSTKPTPFVKHVPHNVARLVLKDLYKWPPTESQIKQ